jgi:ubiquinol-cytochrome c reductase cytochrome b subunit
MTSSSPDEPGSSDAGANVPIDGPDAATDFADNESVPTWTGGLRRAWMRTLPPDKLLPDRQPAYVASWIYIFGVATLAAFLVILATGLILAFAGPTWYHTSSVGHFTNSLHFWSVQLFFIFMVVHLWGKFWMAAWRGRRVLTWISGVVAFLASIGTAFTGYLVQTNFDSQWISFEAKDGLNAVGIGAFFNVANLGQMLLLHACLLPLVVGFIVVWHVLLVRRRGVVPPIDAVDHQVSSLAEATDAASEATP